MSPGYVQQLLWRSWLPLPWAMCPLDLPWLLLRLWTFLFHFVCHRWEMLACAIPAAAPRFLLQPTLPPSPPAIAAWRRSGWATPPLQERGNHYTRPARLGATTASAGCDWNCSITTPCKTKQNKAKHEKRHFREGYTATGNVKRKKALKCIWTRGCLGLKGRYLGNSNPLPPNYLEKKKY